MTAIEKLDMNVKQANSDFQAIKSKIVEKGVEVADGTPTADYASKVDEVYEAGKQSEYDAFWDAAQENGNRTNYNFAFSADMWTKENFKPKYPIRPTDAYNTFAYIGQYLGELSSPQRMDFRELCILDMSLCKVSQNLFYNNRQVVALGVMDLRSMVSFNKMFVGANNLEIIEKIILKEDGSQEISSPFENCKSLKTISFEGIIGETINFQWSTLLEKASITSIVNALSTAVSKKTLTLSKTAVNNAFEGGSEGSEWKTLIATKSSWTISLV